MARSSKQGALWVRLSAALLATLPVAVLGGMALAVFAPASSEARAAIALYSPLPLYVLFACLAMRTRGTAAWLVCGIATALLWLTLSSLAG